MRWREKMLTVMRWSVLLPALMVFSMPAFAVDTPAWGGTGGGPFNQECGGESLLIGFEYTSGKALDSVGAICGIRRNGDWTGDIVRKGRVGGRGGGGPFIVQCPPFNAVAGIQVFVDGNQIVRHLGVGCFPVPGPQLTYLDTKNTGGVDAWNAHSDCPAFQFATGIWGSSGNLVDKIGLHCMAPVLKKAAPPAPAASTGTTPYQVLSGLLTEDEKRVTGKTVAQCQVSNAICTQKVTTGAMQMMPQNGAAFAQGMATQVCGGILGQCLANAAKETPAPPDQPTPPPAGGNTATAPGGTTIYKQPSGDDSQANIAGFVPPGGSVTIVQCGGGFCQISKPKAGFVWGEDIGH